MLDRRRRLHHHHRHHSFFTRPLTINGNSPLSTETLTCKANVFTPRLGPPGFNTRSRSDGVLYWMDGRIGWQAMACHPIDPPAIQCTTPLHLEQQYLQASWKGGSPCTTITGHHAPSSKRGCVRCLGILQSSVSLCKLCAMFELLPVGLLPVGLRISRRIRPCQRTYHSSDIPPKSLLRHS